MTNKTTLGRHLGFAAAMLAMAISAQAATPAQNSKFINQMYEDLLGRPPDRLSEAIFGMLLANGGSRTQVAGFLTGSNEYMTKLIQQTYSQYLNRNPTAGETSFYLNYLHNGATDDQMRDAILGGDEFFNLAGGSNARFLSKLYQDVLGRQIDRISEATLLGYLGNGFTRLMIAEMVLKSLESDQRKVEQFYTRFLRRPADPAGLNTWVQMLQLGMKEEAVIDSLVGSDEYFQWAISH